MKEQCIIIILHHAIGNTMANMINATYAWHMTGRSDEIPSNMQGLSCILVGCIFYGMV